MIPDSDARNQTIAETAHIPHTQAPSTVVSTSAATTQSIQIIAQPGPSTMVDTTMAEQPREVPPPQTIQAPGHQLDMAVLPVLNNQPQYMAPQIDLNFQP
jgi:hypothetical protein